MGSTKKNIISKIKKLVFFCVDIEDLKRKIQNQEFGDKAIFNFLNAHDIYNYVGIEAFRNSLLDTETKQINLVDGSLNLLILSMKSFRRITKIRGATFTKVFLNDRDSDDEKKHFFIGLNEEKKNYFTKKTNLKKDSFRGYEPPYIQEIRFSGEEKEKIAKKITEFKADYVWVCVGSPKQNILSVELSKMAGLGSVYFFNIGAALDFITGKKKEPPKIMQKLGIEWVYRVATDFNHNRRKGWKNFIGGFHAFKIVEVEGVD